VREWKENQEKVERDKGTEEFTKPGVATQPAQRLENPNLVFLASLTLLFWPLVT